MDINNHLDLKKNMEKEFYKTFYFQSLPLQGE